MIQCIHNISRVTIKIFFGVSDNVSHTQIGLFSQRRYIEALNVGCRNKSEVINLCSENKGADQLRGYHAADLRLCFHACKKQVLS